MSADFCEVDVVPEFINGDKPLENWLPNPVFVNYQVTSLVGIRDANYIEHIVKHYGHCLQHVVIETQGRRFDLQNKAILAKICDLTTQRLEVLSLFNKGIFGIEDIEVEKFVSLLQNNSHTLRKLEFDFFIPWRGEAAELTEAHNKLKRITEVLCSLVNLECIDVCIEGSELVERLTRSASNLTQLTFKKPFGPKELLTLSLILREKSNINYLNLFFISGINQLEDCYEFFQMLEVNSSITVLKLFPIKRAEIHEQFLNSMVRNQCIQEFKFLEISPSAWTRALLDSYGELLENQ
jgi:hypothetical protein